MYIHVLYVYVEVCACSCVCRCVKNESQHSLWVSFFLKPLPFSVLIFHTTLSLSLRTPRLWQLHQLMRLQVVFPSIPFSNRPPYKPRASTFPLRTGSTKPRLLQFTGTHLQIHVHTERIKWSANPTGTSILQLGTLSINYYM